jgi:uncharacterized protein YkwD
MTLKWWGIIAVSAACAAAFSGCAGGADEDARSGAITGPCIPGQVFACVCPDGAISSRTCQSDGLSMSLCACAGGAAGSAGGASVGQPGAAGAGPIAGQAAPAMPEPTGNGGSSGSGGVGGAMMTPRAGTGGMSMDPGMMMPMAGTSGMSAAGTGGSNANPGDEVPAIEHCAPVADWDPAWVAFEDEVLRLVNENRAMGWNCDAEGEFGPAGPLTTQPNLRCAARLHSQDMDMRDYFAHDNPDGDGPSERMDAAMYMGGTWGENIAMGQRTPEQVVSGWMESDGHCANIMRPQFTEIGVGFFQGADRSAFYWTQNFGAACTRRCN